MSTRMTALRPSTDTKSQLKIAAQNLFARYGVDGVTVQQIVSSAGQRNNAALHYHFGSKEELIRQLVVDGAKVLDERRREMLGEIEARGGPTSIREVLVVLVMPVIELATFERWRSYIRFTSALHASDRTMLRDALSGRWNSGYITCFKHLRRMMQLPSDIAEQRLSIFTIYANAILSAREAALEKVPKASRLWDRDFTIENMLDTLEAIVTSPPSAATVALLSSPKKPEARQSKVRT